MNDVVNIETDVLVIGGGAAGARAAYDLSCAGVKTVLAVKGLLGRSGCSVFAGNLNYFGTPEDDDEEAESEVQSEEDVLARAQRNVSFSARYTHYLGDQEYMQNAAKFSQKEFFPWIERNGIYVLRDEKGDIVTDKPENTSAWSVKMGMSGSLVMDMMRKLIQPRKDIHLLEQTTITRLLKNGEDVVGAVALDYLHGKVYVIQAKAVIMAAGSSNYLSLRTTGTRDGAATGWVMAYEAGAKLQNIEIQWYHASDVAYPATWMRLHLYPNPLPNSEHRSKMYTRDGKLFFDCNWYQGNPVPYYLQMKHLVKEVEAGNADFGGGFFSSWQHVESEVLEKLVYQTQFMKKIGIDLKTDMMENGATYHMNVGGVKTNGLTMESDVPGLLIAGSVAGLVTGGLSNSTYDGLVAAKVAEERVRSLDRHIPLDKELVEAEISRVYDLFRTDPSDGLLPGQVKKRIRTVTWEDLNYTKSEESMRKAYDAYTRIEEEDIPRMRLQTNTKRFNFDWVEALDAVDMLAALKLQIQFSLYRKESRGGFYREDFPITDNVDWLAHVIGHKKDNGELSLEKTPVDLPYVRPKEDRANFFDLDY